MLRRGYKQLGRNQLSSWVDRLAAGAFVLSLCGASFAYGHLATKRNWFPMPVLYKAKDAASAYLDIEAAGDPPGLVRYADGHEGPEVRRLNDRAENDAILVTGGFFEQPQICPQHGCLAWLMGRSGEILHTWEVDPNAIFTAKELSAHSGFPKPENLNVQGIDMTADGGLVVTLQGRNMFPYYVGVVRLDYEGNIVWKYADFSHHWPTVLSNGDIAIPKAEILQPVPDVVADTAMPSECEGAVSAIYQEGMRIRGKDGQAIREIKFEDLLISNDLKGLIYAVRDDCDPYHINGIAELNENAARQIPGAEPGDLVVSLRSPSALLIVDRTDDTVHHVISGPMVAQHSPVVFADGRIAVFDNLGGEPSQGGSRILAFDLAQGTHEVLFPRPGGYNKLSSSAQGSVRLSDDGSRALIGETLNGRLIEVDLTTGQLLWELENFTSLALFNKRAVSPSKHQTALMNTQGADYVSFDWMGSNGLKADYKGPGLLAGDG